MWFAEDCGIIHLLKEAQKFQNVTFSVTIPLLDKPIKIDYLSVVTFIRSHSLSARIAHCHCAGTGSIPVGTAVKIIGHSYNGSTGVSKTLSVGSIPTWPVNQHCEEK